MIIENIFLRMVFGFYVMAIGLAFLKIYYDRDKDSLWGEIYRTSKKMMKWRSLVHGKVYLFLGWLSIIMGMVVLFYGFCSNIGGC